MSNKTKNNELLEFTTEIVAAQAAGSGVDPDDLPQLIKNVYQALAGLGSAEVSPEKPRPVVSVKKSVFPDYIICLEDGKKLKMLKRHLRTAYDMSPDDYRDRWGLPADYPMVAPSYAKHRSKLAKKIGLGTRPRKK